MKIGLNFQQQAFERENLNWLCYNYYRRYIIISSPVFFLSTFLVLNHMMSLLQLFIFPKSFFQILPFKSVTEFYVPIKQI